MSPPGCVRNGWRNACWWPWPCPAALNVEINAAGIIFDPPLVWQTFSVYKGRRERKSARMEREREREGGREGGRKGGREGKEERVGGRKKGRKQKEKKTVGGDSN